ncbi:probable serine/threonine-protein kinase PBL2 [Rutidosis leptorrhynchoides]|uniref:probable serine/threonine-protein kinase PBL2 n=1 Tax=Rutidosis leptorrhynchoides TaxID=125765 RepID=UPI003A98F99D
MTLDQSDYSLPKFGFVRRLSDKISLSRIHRNHVGLLLLLTECYIEVIFRDFKESSILLDEDFNPNILDFDLVKEGPTVGNTHISTVVICAHGYAAPGYIKAFHLLAKSDVWSFGRTFGSNDGSCAQSLTIPPVVPNVRFGNKHIKYVTN